jgi:hypothetical protein
VHYIFSSRKTEGGKPNYLLRFYIGGNINWAPGFFCDHPRSVRGKAQAPLPRLWFVNWESYILLTENNHTSTANFSFVHRFFFYFWKPTRSNLLRLKQDVAWIWKALRPRVRLRSTPTMLEVCSCTPWSPARILAAAHQTMVSLKLWSCLAWQQREFVSWTSLDTNTWTCVLAYLMVRDTTTINPTPDCHCLTFADFLDASYSYLFLHSTTYGWQDFQYCWTMPYTYSILWCI